RQPAEQGSRCVRRLGRPAKGPRCRLRLLRRQGAAAFRPAPELRRSDRYFGLRGAWGRRRRRSRRSRGPRPPHRQSSRLRLLVPRRRRVPLVPRFPLKPPAILDHFSLFPAVPDFLLLSIATPLLAALVLLVPAPLSARKTIAGI